LKGVNYLEASRKSASHRAFDELDAADTVMPRKTNSGLFSAKAKGRRPVSQNIHKVKHTGSVPNAGINNRITVQNRQTSDLRGRNETRDFQHMQMHRSRVTDRRDTELEKTLPTMRFAPQGSRSRAAGQIQAHGMPHSSTKTVEIPSVVRRGSAAGWQRQAEHHPEHSARTLQRHPSVGSRTRSNARKRKRLLRTVLVSACILVILCALTVGVVFAVKASVPTVPDIVLTSPSVYYSMMDPEGSIKSAASETVSDETGSADQLSSDGSADTQDAASENDVWFTVKISQYGHDTFSCVTKQTTAGELLAKAGVQISESEKSSVDADTVLTSDTEIDIDTVVYKTETVKESVAYGTQYVDDDTLASGKTKLKSAGVKGVNEITYLVEYIDDKEVSRTEQSTAVISSPVDEVYYKGTAQAINGYAYSYYIDCTATTYSGGVGTASGLPVGENIIAVDPTVIPYGTKCYVIGSYGDFGVRIAADTGTAIKGNAIDVWLYKSNPLYSSFGRRTLRVYILK
jgi:3D (Asp-Asp-Asp) domain-containing protein